MIQKDAEEKRERTKRFGKKNWQRGERHVTVSPAISPLEFIRSFLFRNSGFMLEVRINHWVCFHGTCIVNILKLWTIKWNWKQKWAESCTFRDKWHAHRTFLYRVFSVSWSLCPHQLVQLLWPLGVSVLQRMTKRPHSHQENWSSNCKL